MRERRMKLVIAMLGLLLTVACSSSDDGDNGDNGDNGESGSPVGSWLGTLATAIPGPDDILFDRMILDVGEDTVSAFMYYETVQATGWIGFYEHDHEAGEILVTIEYLWQASLSDYVALDEPFEMPYPFTYSATTMSVLTPDATSVELDKVTFGYPAALVGDWFLDMGDDHMQISAQASGTYEFEQDGPNLGAYSESGEWSATGDTEGYLRTVTDTIDGESMTIEALTRYEIVTDGDETILRLFWPTDGEETGFDFQYQ